MELSDQIKDSAMGMATIAMAIIAHFDQYTMVNNVLAMALFYGRPI